MARFTEVDIRVPLGGPRSVRARDGNEYAPQHVRDAEERLRFKFPNVKQDEPDYGQPYLSGSGHSWTQNPDENEREPREEPQWWLVGTVVYPALTPQLVRTAIEGGVLTESGARLRNEREVSFEPSTAR